MKVSKMSNELTPYYVATIITPLIHVTVTGDSHFDAIKRCLQAYNLRTYYDLNYVTTGN